MRAFNWRRAVDFLSPLGLLVIVGVQWWQRAGKTLPGKEQYYLAAGLALVFLHVALRWDDIVRSVGQRQMRYGGNTLVLVAVVGAILFGINYLVYRHDKQWDLTKGKRYSLSDQAKKVLGGLDEDVTVWYFQRAAQMREAEERMGLFTRASPRLKVQYVDPVANPARAQEFDARGPYPLLVVERGTRRERASNDSEQDVVNAIVKVTRDKTKTVCFVEGEGERAVADSGDRGYSAAKAALEKSQYQTQTVVLAREPAVPATCTAIVVAGPERDLLPHEIDALRRFVSAGGKALVMVDPPVKQDVPNLTALLKEWKLEAGKDVIVDVSPMGQVFGTGPLTPIAMQYPYHEITRDFRLMTAFHTARSLKAVTEGGTAGVTAQNLVETAPASWAETDLALKEPIEMDEGKDTRGPVSLGAVATVPATAPLPVASPSPSAAPAVVASPSPAAASPSPSPSASPSEEPAAPREGRVVAFGDADFASNQLLSFGGNEDFFLNAVAWLAEDADLISIRPREPEDQRMFLSVGQQQTIWLVSRWLIPLAFVLAGIVSWWRRRA
jgi:gliding motility-associatede transport system auxiliary component